MRITGRHCLLECFHCPGDVLDDAPLLEQFAREAAAAAQATVLEVVRARFSPAGVTVLALLAESHLSIHTWPEQGYAAVDCFTCGARCQPELACQLLAQRLGALRHVIRQMERGEDAVGDTLAPAGPADPACPDAAPSGANAS